MLKRSTAVLAILIMSGLPVLAQYEGEIRFNVYDPDRMNEGNVIMAMTFAEDRIFLDTNVSLNVMAGLQARGFLVRNDMNDMMIITAENEALKVAKSEIESLAMLIDRVKGNREDTDPEPFPWEDRVVQTGEKRDFYGYTAEKFSVKGDREGEYAEVWLTEEISVDWGLLLDAWYNIGVKQFDQEVPIEILMNRQSFPMLVEAYRNNRIVFRAESVYENSETFDRSKSNLSSNVKVIGLTDLMMSIFMQN
ncbi:MAG: hypothetical protein GVY02_03305 [Bacteroidetes bacterium]|jgi:hypothetical protein|nr:hypothetical protein [Bacteroidota bacterium]